MATYIIRAGLSGPVKIGKADDVDARLAQLQTGHHEPLTLLRVIDTPFDAEPAFHREFSALRIRGEWFSFDARMLTLVPPSPSSEPPVSEVMRQARRAAKDECVTLIKLIWERHRGLMGRKAFEKHMAALLECSERRVRALRDREARRIEVHELEGLRSLVRKLHNEGDGREAGGGVGPRHSTKIATGG